MPSFNPYGMSIPKILKVKDEFKLSTSFNNFKCCRFTWFSRYCSTLVCQQTIQVFCV